MMNAQPPPAARPPSRSSEFQASVLFCGSCRAPRPVRERLLLVLPDGELYEYLCAGLRLVGGLAQGLGARSRHRPRLIPDRYSPATGKEGSSSRRRRRTSSRAATSTRFTQHVVLAQAAVTRPGGLGDPRVESLLHLHASGPRSGRSGRRPPTRVRALPEVRRVQDEVVDAATSWTDWKRSSGGHVRGLHEGAMDAVGDGAAMLGGPCRGRG